MRRSYLNQLKVALIHLGCPKNQVDSECMVGLLHDNGYRICSEAAEADVIIVNTCGFIESAKQESVDAILEAARYKQVGRCRSLIVVGCLAQRYAEELRREMPEVDAFVGVGQYQDLSDTIRRTIEGERVLGVGHPPGSWVEYGSRIRSTPPWTAYLNISDGCDNRCAYCAIPDIRGRYRSRPPELVLAEAERMAADGVKEINLVGQDTTLYGADLRDVSAFGPCRQSMFRDLGLAVSHDLRPTEIPKHRLSVDGNSGTSRGDWTLERLLGELARLDFHWIRLLYCYPTRVSDALIERIAAEPSICKYIDLPLQHGDDRVLARMGRRGTSGEYLKLLCRLRAACPEIALRSSFVVGFPGESDEEFENLLRFLEKARFDRAGAFRYSREEGTPAVRLGGQVPRKVVEKRYGRLMELQQAISFERNQAFVGRQMEVLVESDDPPFGRSYRDAPEIDGVVYLNGDSIEPGSIVRAVVTEARQYDLTAEIGRNTLEHIGCEAKKGRNAAAGRSHLS